MDKNFDHKKYEAEIYKLWEESKSFVPKKDSKPFTIVMPPPNANDPLHIGHAMFITIEDILIRYHRMLGESSLWLPGTDHAGIETQFVFEKKLAKKDQSRSDFDRETLYKMIWDYVQDNSGMAVDQMKKIGASADWRRFKFTLDPKIVNLVLETFVNLHNDKLVYRGERLVNYCTRCGTSYSELEVEHIEEEAKLYFIKYGPFVLATTRPETKFADTAVAVHPKDKRYKDYVGKEIECDGLLGKFKLKVIADEYVDPEFGTGVVKITPYHDFNDFDVWMRHKDEIPEPKKVIDQFGRLTEIAGKYAGLKIKAAREAVEKDLSQAGLLAKPTETYLHNVGVCYKCKTVLEPLPIAQFFINTKPLAQKALKALDNKETVILGTGQEKILRHWLINIKDWNISRQIVWGIRIPVWYSVSENPNLIVTFKDSKDQKQTGKISDFKLDEVAEGIQSLTAPKDASYVVSLEKPGEGYIQETDTFDTWFSSGQWPVVTLKAGHENDYEKFYPTSVMETGYDILPIWVMRMMLLCIYTTGKTPFKTVYLHGLVRDEQGRKMSKSIGNVINPLEAVDKYGADALRFALVVSSTPAQDKNVGESSFKAMRNFANKIWNAARFVKDFESSEDTKELDSKILKALEDHISSVTDKLERFKIGLAAESVYEWFWHTFCDSHIELAKEGKISKRVMIHTLIANLKLIHPFMPFVTEAIWEQIKDLRSHTDTLLINSSWPKVK